MASHPHTLTVNRWKRVHVPQHEFRRTIGAREFLIVIIPTTTIAAIIGHYGGTALFRITRSPFVTIAIGLTITVTMVAWAVWYATRYRPDSPRTRTPHR